MIDGIISAAFTREHKCTKADLGAGEMKDDAKGGEGESMSEVGVGWGGDTFSNSFQRM